MCGCTLLKTASTSGDTECVLVPSAPLVIFPFKKDTYTFQKRHLHIPKRVAVGVCYKILTTLQGTVGVFFFLESNGFCLLLITLPPPRPKPNCICNSGPALNAKRRRLYVLFTRFKETLPPPRPKPNCICNSGARALNAKRRRLRAFHTLQGDSKIASGA